MRTALRAAALVATAVVALAGCAPSETTGASVPNQGYVSGDGSVQTWDVDERGEPVAVTGTTYQGEQVDTADWLGQIVVLNTWYAACPPCRSEAPTLAALARDRADDGVRLLGINVEDAAGAALAFERTFDIPYPSIDDSGGTAVSALSGTIPLQAVPTTVILDRQGRVAARIVGLAEESTLGAVVDDVVAESGAP
ncbi:TlpA family protein disulfide reductase [Cellulomonas sp. PS-H5]|nr:TlpA family protein disulfide reductase [Cellulomonas sp. PS-H5]